MRPLKVIKIICIILLLPYVLMLSGSILSAHMIGLSDTKKIELMQSASYKKLNIDSIEKFDKHFKPSMAPLRNPFFITNFIIVLGLSLGLWNLKKWAWIAMLFYAVFNIISKILLFRSIAVISKPSLFGALFFSTIWAIIIYYFTRPKVREQFK